MLWRANTFKSILRLVTLEMIRVLSFYKYNSTTKSIMTISRRRVKDDTMLSYLIGSYGLYGGRDKIRWKYHLSHEKDLNSLSYAE